MAKRSLRCADCQQFSLEKGCCGWLIPECKGGDSTFAGECALFTDHTGYSPLLDCDDDQLPAWFRQINLPL